MDLNLLLWTGGMVFTLGIFATKVGLGLGYGGVRWRGALLTHIVYFGLFVVAALLCEPLMSVLRPILGAGPYLHSAAALILLGWGIHLLRGYHASHCSMSSAHALALLVPCPVCFSAVVFSTWTALEIVDMPPLLVGAGMGFVFAVMTSSLHLSVRWRSDSRDARSSSLALGFTMIAIGTYFLASLLIPARIEEAGRVYHTFAANNAEIGSGVSGGGVVVLLGVVAIAGYLMRGKANRRQTPR